MITALNYPENPELYNGDPVHNYISKDFVLVQNMAAVDRSFFPLNQPLVLEYGRCGIVTQGSARYVINLRTYDLHPGMAIVLPQSCVVEKVWMSADCNGKVFTFNEAGDTKVFDTCEFIHLDSEGVEKMECYFDLMARTVRQKNFSLRTIHLLQAAVLNDLKNESDRRSSSASLPSRSERMFNDFLDLLSKYGDTQRRIPFYAKCLHISPNRLSSVVKLCSGQTALFWINRHTVLEARILLRHTDLPVYVIAERLGFASASFFVQFFRKETGLTPLKYRASQGE